MKLTDQLIATFVAIPLQSLAIFAGTTLACLVSLWVFLSYIKRRFSTANNNSIVIVQSVRTLVDATLPSSVILLAVLAGLAAVGLSADFNRYLFLALITLGIIQVAHWVSNVINVWISSKLRGPNRSSLHSARGLLVSTSRLAVWSLAFVVFLSNIGVDVTALVAGLGIGGVAVAFAMQNILGDLFASLSIILDRPFEVGDFIIVGEVLGTVENIGVKTTTIRSLSGEQILLSNSDLLGSRIRNFKRMQERRVLFNIGIVYETPQEKVAQVPGWIRDIINAQSLTRFDRAHFRTFGDFALNIEVVYFVQSSEFNIHADIQQAINLQIMSKFATEGVAFAYPTQVVHLEKGTVSE